MKLSKKFSPEAAGFANYGADTFGSEFPKIQKLGLLPTDFEKKFQVHLATNEKGDQVKTAHFLFPEAGKQAVTALLAYDQHLLFEDWARLGISKANFSADEIFFYTYLYYNASPNKKDGELNTESDFHEYFHNQQNIGIKVSPYQVASGARWLQKSGVFDQSNTASNWYNHQQ